MWVVLTAVGVTVAVLLVLAVGCAGFYKRYRERARLRLARELLHRRREWLEAEFLTKASASGQPRRFVWENCEFDNAFSLARDRHSGQLRALVGVTIALAPIDEDRADGLETAVSQREATAVFHFDGTQWMTDGRAVFNLNPAETIQRYSHELELVE